MVDAERLILSCHGKGQKYVISNANITDLIKMSKSDQPGKKLFCTSQISFFDISKKCNFKFCSFNKYFICFIFHLVISSRLEVLIKNLNSMKLNSMEQNNSKCATASPIREWIFYECRTSQAFMRSISGSWSIWMNFVQKSTSRHCELSDVIAWINS